MANLERRVVCKYVSQISFANTVSFANGKLRICDLRTQYFSQLADMRFAVPNLSQMSLSYGGKFSDLQVADCSPKKFAGLQFAVQLKEICGFEIFGLKYLRNLRILIVN